MRFGIIVFPSSNSHKDMVYILKNIMEQEVTELWHKEVDLKNIDVLIIPGGYNYELLFSKKIETPALDKIKKYADKGGLIFGIGSGFSLLCELGLLDGELLENKSGYFICKNTYVKIERYDKNRDNGDALKLPITHEKGRFWADEKTLKKLNDNKQVVFRYCSFDGKVNCLSNPDGSVENIAGICNEKRNVFGISPFPDRASDDELGNTDGKYAFDLVIRTLNKSRYK